MAQNETPDPNPGGVSRRGLLKTGALAAAVAPMASWRRSGPDRAGLRKPGSLPYPWLPPGTDTIRRIEHIVVVMMENHSYDNHLGMLRRPGADGFRLGWNGRPLASNPYPDGRVQHAFRMPATCQLPGHPAQDWLASHVQYDNGRLDGFVKSASGP